ncbi:hypothetical protein Tco_0900349, partial [Tanacetum coccineum]
MDIKECNTPFETSVKLEVNSGRVVAQLEYASVIDSLMYAMHCTRPDIAFAVSKLSQYTTEFIALAAAGKEAEWIQDLLMDIRLWPGPMPLIPMYCDSKAALSIAYNSFSATTITLQTCDVATQGTKMVFVAALGFTAAAFWVVCLLSSWSTNVIFMVLVLFTDASL